MDTHVTEWIYRLTDFAIAKGLIEAQDRAFYVNRLLEAMRMDAPEEIDYVAVPAPETATQMLDALADDAAARGVIEDSGERRDLFSARLMGLLTPDPQRVRERFFALYREDGPVAATEWFYRLCRDCDYIKVDRIAKNMRFFEDTEAGKLEITINLSKPEKDPRDIAAQRSAKQTGYPKCMLCPENPGYAGRIGFPARQNHRMIPLTLNGKRWHMQYSPYLYYGEHCIVLNDEHVPMRISHDGFARMFDFVDQFPHYFIGSNADLPIVGGSILSHDHFQGGNHRFPMDEAGVWIALKEPRAGVSACVADWPMSCVRLESASREDLIALADEMLAAWRKWSDPACDIYAETDQPHNTITPILRMESGKYRLSLVLRNNRTSEEHPLGIFHPHAELHHIKKENIGLIEVMGLFILPGRLKKELAEVERALVEGTPVAEAHAAWTEELRAQPGAKDDPVGTVRRGLGKKCARVLADAGVYKHDENGRAGFVRFLESIGYQEA